MGQTYLKNRLRWPNDSETCLYYNRIVGVGVDCDADAEGYFLNSDGSKTFTSDENAALILLFSRTLAVRETKLSIFDKIRCALAKILLNI